MKPDRFLFILPATAAIFLVLLLATNAPAIDAGRSLYIEGYPGQLSYAPGDEIAFHVSTSAPKYSIEIARLGAKREIVYGEKDIAGAEYPVPERGSAEGCGWPAGHRVPIPADWRSGYYEVSLRVADSGGAFTQRNRRTAEGSFFFVLRPAQPGRDTRILLQLATNTYNAYNNWGGSSLYAYHGRAKLQGNEVSFLRPPRSLYGKWEQAFVAWAEENGYHLDFCTNMDLELLPELIENYRLVLSVGHDEYWSSGMRDTVEKFVASGGNAAFFSGNTCCWQVRWQEESRSLVCWKQWFNQDELYTDESNRHLLATLWSHHLVGRPENEMMGVGFLHGGYHRSHGQLMDGKGSYTVHRPKHWIFEGTGLKQNDEFGGKDTIVGYECDGCEIEWRGGLPFPTHSDGTPKTFTILGTCPAKWAGGDSFWYERWPGPDHSGHSVLGAWTHESGGTVFTCGSTDWSHGLKGADAAVERITRNILERLGK